MERAREALAGGLQCLRFFNSDMYYSAAELQLLLRALDATTAAQVSTVPVHKSNSFRESRLYTTYPLLPRVSSLCLCLLCACSLACYLLSYRRFVAIVSDGRSSASA